MSSCGRNWYITDAKVTDGLDIWPTPAARKRRIRSGPIYDLFLMLTVMLDAEKTFEVEETAYFHFTDIDEHIVLKVCPETKRRETLGL